MKPARKAISTPRGEGTRGTTGDREQVWGQRLGRVLTTLPWFPLIPNLACTNEETPRGESPDGTTPRVPTATRPRVPTATRPRHHRHRITVVGMCCVEGSLMKSEWGKQVRALVTYLVPSRPDDSPPSVVRRHHKHENADEHSANSMSPYILSLMRSEWGMRGAPVHLHPSSQDGSPPSAVRRHHKHENTDEHSASSMSPHIPPALCLTNMFRNTRTYRVRHSDIDMFLNTRRCCSEGGMRGALVHLQPTRPRVSNRDRGHLRGALQESDRILHERFLHERSFPSV